MAGRLVLVASLVAALAAPALPLSVSATLNAAALDTKSADRDNDLRGPDWFDTAKYPTMSFVSTRIEGKGPGDFTILGNLTMHGVTKPVTLAAKFEGKMVDARGRSHVAYTATTTIDRRDFGLNFGKTVPGGALVAGFDISIRLSVEAIAAGGHPT